MANDAYRAVAKQTVTAMYLLAKAQWVVCGLLLLPGLIAAQSWLPSTSELKKLSVEQLMNIEVTSVSRGPEKLTEVASAIQVITGEDIMRSGATRLPEVLRLVSNLQVARSNSHDWGITARGFNGAPLSTNTLADKLLVMIDGRSVYTPLFGGVFWDVQNVLLEDIDRIEVVSGPGGTLWGANAVNGVINIITKSAKETQGLYVSGTTGTFMNSQVAMRYGTHIDSTFFFRVYGQQFDQGSMKLRNGNDARDRWNLAQGGFRMEFLPSVKNKLTLQGDIYGGKEDEPTNTTVNGQNILARWTHSFSHKSELSVQAYFDRTWRDLSVAQFADRLKTYDIDVQHRFYAGSRHNILWGIGYRVMQDETKDAPSLFFTPSNRTLKLFNSFVQDQITLVQDHLELTIGTKLLHNDYTKYELQPSLRLAWTPRVKYTLWAAISRAVRTPSRFDAEETAGTLTNVNKPFNSEKVLAYEIGYRVRPVNRLSFSLAAYYNKYTDLRSINATATAPPAFAFANDQSAESWGFEFFGNLVVSDKWRLRGGYTYLDKKFYSHSAAVRPASAVFEGIDPRNQLMIQSILDLPGNFQLDLVGRYTDVLPQAGTSTPMVRAYFSYDARLAWEYKRCTIAVVGQDLADPYHTEFGSRQIPRSVYAKIALRF